jgi:uncharacterized protein
MNIYLLFSLFFVAACVQASDNQTASLVKPLCSASWYRSIEQKLPTSDAQMHGPDIGSEEWKSVIEFKLGVRNKPNVPDSNSESWCRYIDQLVRERGPVSNSSDNLPGQVNAQGPAYACDKAEPGSIEAMICEDRQLSTLDRKLSVVYAAASSKAANEQPPRLKAEQRGWIKGRNDCWKSDGKSGCVRNEYLFRIAELQARYRLVPATGPVRYLCNGNPANEVVATFFRTGPPTLIAEHRDSVSLMYRQPSASGARYQGRNETFWEHQGEALITWGYGAETMRCKKMQ